LSHSGLPGGGALDAAHHDDVAELALTPTDARGLVGQEHSEILEGSGGGQLLLHDGAGCTHQVQLLFRHLLHDGGREGRAGEGDALVDFLREAEGFADFPDAVFTQFGERFEDAVAELLLGVDAYLGEDVVLALDARDGLVDVAEDGAIEEEAGARLVDESAEELRVEGLGDGLALGLGVGEATWRVPFDQVVKGRGLRGFQRPKRWLLISPPPP
jgi:hypothetical protein